MTPRSPRSPAPVAEYRPRVAGPAVAVAILVAAGLALAATVLAAASPGETGSAGRAAKPSSAAAVSADEALTPGAHVWLTDLLPD